MQPDYDVNFQLFITRIVSSSVLIAASEPKPVALGLPMLVQILRPYRYPFCGEVHR
jgi:hypothetical protein